ncbi:MAG TPA: lipocalin family protein [Polyangiaceae bacterium]|nr:lipocalin family protein [Polyangiaceae bacterium]
MSRVASLGGLAFLIAASTVAGCNGPPLQVAQGVDLSQFQGKWYEIARLPRLTETGCFGTTAFYTQNVDGTLTFVNQCNVGSTTGPLNTVSMIATVPDTSVSAKLALQVGGFSGNYWILEVGPSYEYAVVGDPSRSYLWILGRSSTLDTATMQGIVDRAQANLFDTSQLQYTPQPPAGERDELSSPQGPVPPALQTGCSVSRSAGATGGSLAWISAAIATVVGATRRRTGFDRPRRAGRPGHTERVGRTGGPGRAGERGGHTGKSR